VEVESDRRYRFAVGPEELWSALTRVEDYRSWWPWLRHFDGSAFAAGERWACVVQPPLPYSLRFTISLREVVAPRFVTATIEGDIGGEARIDVSGSGAASELHLVSRLAPITGVMRRIARVARPVVRFGHDWVLDTGFRQFERRAL
jgi:uncharacterized protein YndB with AHSA1/START domain